MLAGILLATICLAAARGQTVAAPALQHRNAASTPVSTPQAAFRGRSLLPEQASGEYMLDEAGGIIQITLERGRITGYLSRGGDEDSDRGTPLTYFFDRTIATGDRLEFTTRQVHGLWYSFAGTIVRGPAQSPSQAGYYLLTGSLLLHDSVQHTEDRRTVRLRMEPQE